MTHRPRLAAAALSAALLAVPAAAAPVSDPATLRAIDEAAQAALKGGHAVGFALGVADHGRMVFAKGYGSANLETGAPVTPDTVFRIASINKQFTAAAILLLSERGQVGLDDPLAKYLPNFPRSGEITIRQLLTHTSGLKDYAGTGEFWLGRSRLDTSTTAFVDFIAGLKPLYDFEPGTRFRYSNSGYYLLGAVIEKVSDKPLAEFLQSEIFARVGMINTAIDKAEDIVPHRASGYEPKAGGGFRNAPFISMSTIGGNGSMRSTLGDLARWHAALLAGKVIRPESVKLMLTPGRLKDGRLASDAVLEGEERSSADDAPAKPKPAQPAEPRRDYGFGMNLEIVKGHASIAHEGGINGFRSRLETFPKDEVTLVFLANTGEKTPNVPKTVTEIVLKRLDAK